jgi:23S rRNA pseudouridine1911/1915/1917 synthase
MVEYPPPDPELAHLARKNLVFTVASDQAGQRLDKFVTDRTGLTRGKIRELVDFGAVWLGGKVCRRQSHPLQAGDLVTFQAPVYGPVRFYEFDQERVVYEDQWLLAYDKEAGIPCQQTPYDGYNNLFAALKRQTTGYLALHHRLDSPTSGVMVFARRQQANAGLSRIFRQGAMEKIYLAVVKGLPESDAWESDLPIAKQKGSYYCPPDRVGKPALTRFKVLARGRDTTLIQARPLTGRTHQIRLHLTACGHPILGDTFYEGSPAPRLMLHALSLSFDHPVTGQPLALVAPAPPGFEAEEV